MSAALRASLLASAFTAAAIVGCSVGDRGIVLYDDALRLALANQPSDYGKVAQWAHQFMTTADAMEMMERQDYLCLGETCRYRGRDFMVGEQEVKLVSEDGHLRRATGTRWWSFGGGYGLELGRLEAPGVDFADAQSFTALMADWLRGRGKVPRTQTYLPPWDGKPVAVGSFAGTMATLDRLGFKCVFAPGASEDAVISKCGNRSFSGQEQDLWLTVATEDLALVRLEGRIGGQAVAIALTGPPDADETSVRALVLGEDKRWRLFVLDGAASAPGGEAKAAAAYAGLDASSRQRVLRAVARQLDARFRIDGDDALRPVLQQIEQAALDLRRLGKHAVSGGHEAARSALPKTYATFMLAECDSLPLAEGRACFERYAAARSELRTLLAEAIAEAAPPQLALAADHPVSRRVKQLRALAGS